MVLRVVDWPSKDVLDDLGIDDSLDLTGLYDGTPIMMKSISEPDPFPDTIWLFRRPILDELGTRPVITLDQLLAYVVIHESAHHFGWTDDDIVAVDRWWE